jgi:hypothetical protein
MCRHGCEQDIITGDACERPHESPNHAYMILMFAVNHRAGVPRNWSLTTKCQKVTTDCLNLALTRWPAAAAGASIPQRSLLEDINHVVNFL